MLAPQAKVTRPRGKSPESFKGPIVSVETLKAKAAAGEKNRRGRPLAPHGCWAAAVIA
jgi:hypothetical protein